MNSLICKGIFVSSLTKLNTHLLCSTISSGNMTYAKNKKNNQVIVLLIFNLLSTIPLLYLN